MSVMSLLGKTKSLLRKHQIFPKKRLGQNFTADASVFQCISSYATIDRNDVVLDIGAGLGFLTRFLAKKCKRVLAVESDVRLVTVLHEQLKDLANVEIIEGDILRVHVSEFNKVVSIPPYYISSSLLSWLFNRNFECAVLIFQKEFASRLVASIGSEDYGWLTVVTYQRVEVELLNEIPKRIFYPEPEVNSIIVRLTPKRPPPFTVKNKALFQQLAQSLFRQRNRKVRNAVLPIIKCKHATKNTVKLADSLPFHDKRVRDLAPEDFGALANVLFK